MQVRKGRSSARRIAGPNWKKHLELVSLKR
jgi:hypothetical protein